MTDDSLALPSDHRQRLEGHSNSHMARLAGRITVICDKACKTVSNHTPFRQVHRWLIGGIVILATTCRCFAAEVDPAAAVLSQARDAIAVHRMGTLTIQARPGATVKVIQLRHEFNFGTALAHQVWQATTAPETREKYLQLVRENFNCAVHENAMKWMHVEPVQGQLHWQDAETILAWCTENDIPMRGHCVFWAKKQFICPWLIKMEDHELRGPMQQRAHDVATRFKGRIREYDLNNEMTKGDMYASCLGDGITKEMFDWFKKDDPSAVLYVNDYAILTGKDGPKYIAHIKKLLEQGVPVDGIGCQGHFEQPPDAVYMKGMLDQLAQFKLPIKITEYDTNTKDERVLADSLETAYTVAFGHPAVEGILMWGFWAGLHWRPNAALWRTDFSPTLAAARYRSLVFGQWWTTREGQTDANGRFEVRAFYGRYAVEIDGIRQVVELKKAQGALTVKMEKNP